MNLTDQISEFIVRTRFSDIPEEVVREALNDILQLMGILTFGREESRIVK